MTYALIDNATLTAVQRVTGQVTSKSKDSADTDIIALENLVQAILLYDQVIAVDDYIPRYREERISAFPFIAFLNCQDFNLASIEKTAEDKAAEIRPVIRGGEFENEDFKNLIELLQTHIICTWDISSSIYYLTLKGLSVAGSEEFKKYGQLAASIFSELRDATETGHRTSGDVALIDRFGNPITNDYKVPGARWGDGSTGGTTRAIHAFVAALIWLSNRSIFYSLSAKYLQADTFLYPIRQAYQQYYISKTCGYGQNYPKYIVEHLSSALSGDLVSIHSAGMVSSTAVDYPIFSAWLAKETGDVAGVLQAAFQVRNEPEFAEAREQLSEIRNALDGDDVATANAHIKKIVSDLATASAYIRDKYGIRTQQGVPVTRMVHVYNTYAALNGFPVLPDYNFNIRLPSFIRDLTRPSGFSAIYRNISNDLSCVWALGEARDILGARIVKEKDAVAYNPKSEAPEYRCAHSPFKSPM